MCSACGEDHEPICDYCGQSCFGRCDDPDTCPHCFYEVVMMRGLDLDDWEDERFEAQNMCFKVGCNCQCHDEYKEDLGMRYEAGGLLVEAQDGPPFERQGVFPLLELPGEIREKIYGFSFLQDGEQRKSSYHRGTIHTNLLRTCRQVYNEAGHLPLTLNKLSFGAPFLAHDFLGFGLAPTQRHLMTGLNIEFYMMEFSNPSWRPLMRELSKMHITHLGLTVKGGFPKEAVDEHPCFANRFKGLKELKTFNLILGSGEIKPAAKMDLQEEMRERLIKGYVRPKDCKTSNTKRTANTETDPSPKKPSKKAKRGDSMVTRVKPNLTHFH